MLRWWDGVHWTEQVRPTVQDAPVAPETWLPEPISALRAARVATRGAPTSRLATPDRPEPHGETSVPTPRRQGVLPAYGTPATLPYGYEGPERSDRGASPSFVAAPPAAAAEAQRVARNRFGAGVASMVVALPLLAIGSLFLFVIVVGGLVPDMMTARVGSGEAATLGTVTDQHARTHSDGDRQCSPDASFTVDGRTYRATADYSSSTCPAIGSPIRVIYPTATPGDGSARVPWSTGDLLLLGIFPLVAVVLTGSGGALTIRGATLVVAGRRRPRP